MKPVGQNPNMPDEDRFKLLFGPYSPPRVQRDDELCCELRGFVRVADFSEGRIPWPQTYKTLNGRVIRRGASDLPIILCGDLVKAVRRESNQAICYWWGVSELRVTKWRKALGVKKITEGTNDIMGQWATIHYSPERVKFLHQRAHSLEVQLKKAADMRANHPRKRHWAQVEDQILGTMTDKEAAKKLGRGLNDVGRRRRQLNIPAFCTTLYVASVRHYIQLCKEQLRQRRIELGLSLQAFSDLAGVDVKNYALMESGQQQTTLRTLQRLAAAFQCRPEELTESTESVNAP